MVRWSRHEIRSTNSSLAAFLATARWEDNKLERGRCLFDTLYVLARLDSPFSSPRCLLRAAASRPAARVLPRSLFCARAYPANNFIYRLARGLARLHFIKRRDNHAERAADHFSSEQPAFNIKQASA